MRYPLILAEQSRTPLQISKGLIMATAAKKDKSKSPMLTKNGKPRLGPLNLEQLNTLLESARNKHKPKILKAIARKTV